MPPGKLSGILNAAGAGSGIMGKVGASVTPPAEPKPEAEKEKTEEISPEEDKEILEAAKAALSSKVKTPKEFWLEELAEVGIKQEDAFSIVDSMLTHGSYTATYRINSKIIVKLRTRITTDTDRLVDILQEMQPTTNSALNHILARVNLASSLVSFGSNVFSHTAPSPTNRETLNQEWQTRYKFCEALPTPMFEVLTQLLSQFDPRVALASDVRGIENF
jgi:DNA polymerase III delta prime subunit